MGWTYRLGGEQVVLSEIQCIKLLKSGCLEDQDGRITLREIIAKYIARIGMQMEITKNRFQWQVLVLGV
jgi:hypothetical protein